MKKRVLALALALCLSLSLLPAAALAAEPVKAIRSALTMTVDGKWVPVESYMIGSNNHIMLRDMATMINNTPKNFEVTYDNTKNAINLISNHAYTPVGGEMADREPVDKLAVPTTSKIYVDGVEKPLIAYTIGGNNYFQLRDVMKTFDVYVGYDQDKGRVSLETAKSYVDPPKPVSAAPTPGDNYYFLESPTEVTGMGLRGVGYLMGGETVIANDDIALEFEILDGGKKDWYNIKLADSGVCLDVNGGKQFDTNKIIYWNKNGGENQLFAFENTGKENFYRLKSYGGFYVGEQGGGLCLTNEQGNAIVFYVSKRMPQREAATVAVNTPYVIGENTSGLRVIGGQIIMKPGVLATIGKQSVAPTFTFKESGKEGFYTISSSNTTEEELFLTIDGEQKDRAYIEFETAKGDESQMFALEPKDGAYLFKSTNGFYVCLNGGLILFSDKELAIPLYLLTFAS